ncbi:hypothetical protein CALCODRAFT_47835 [Calocera cornea HHB12733]|uniref:Uncharacterized protein n=1 Tax=Calocera cornea HHB12733 TaxID=1353952 RepID=A0A165DVA9_9BASI|nr:hypothetical protein CALCODRAFT_47835 [Calocera cornea HHB12733]
MSSTQPGQVSSPEPMSTTSTRPSKRSLESPEQQARGEGEDDRTKRRRSDEDASVGRTEQRTASSSRPMTGASAMERGIRELELQDQQPDRPAMGNADQRTSVDPDASASDIDMDVDEPQASSSAAQLSSVSLPVFSVRLPAISSFDRNRPQSSSSDDDPWHTPNETPQGSQHRARSPPSTEEVRNESARAQNFSNILEPLRRSPPPPPYPGPERASAHFGDFLSRLRLAGRESTSSSSTAGSVFPRDTYSQMGATAPHALPERHAPLSLSLPRSQNSSRASGTVLPRLGAGERLSQVPISPPRPIFEANWLRHPSIGGPSMLPAGQAGVRHQPPPAPHSPLLHPSLHSPPLARSAVGSPEIGRFSPPSHFRRSPVSPYSDESDIAPTIFPGSPYPLYQPSPAAEAHHPELPQNSPRHHNTTDDEQQLPQIPRMQAPLIPNFGRHVRDDAVLSQSSQSASPAPQMQVGPSHSGSNSGQSADRVARPSQEGNNQPMRLPPIRTRGPLPRLSSVVAGISEDQDQRAPRQQQASSRQERDDILSNSNASSREILETLIRMREATSQIAATGATGSRNVSATRSQASAQRDQDLGLYWASARALGQPETSNVREQAPRQDIPQPHTRRDQTGAREMREGTSDAAPQLPSFDALGGLPSSRLMPPPSGSPATPWSIWRTPQPEDRSFTLPHERRNPTQILELSQLLNEVQERGDRLQSSLSNLERGQRAEDVPRILVDAPRVTANRSSSRDVFAVPPIFARENSLGLEMEIAPNTANTSGQPGTNMAPPPRPITPVGSDLAMNAELGITRERMLEALNAVHRDRLELRERIITARLAGLTTSHLEEASRQLRSASHALRGAVAAEARARQMAPNPSASATQADSHPAVQRRETSDERGQAEFVRLMSETEPLLAEHRRTGAAIRQLVGDRPAEVSQSLAVPNANTVPAIGPMTRQDAERAARDSARNTARAEDFLRAYRLEAPAHWARDRATGPDILRRRMPTHFRVSGDGEPTPRPLGAPLRTSSPSPPPVPPRSSPSSRYDPVRDSDHDVHMESARTRMRAVPLTPLGMDSPFYTGRNVACVSPQLTVPSTLIPA